MRPMVVIAVAGWAVGAAVLTGAAAADRRRRSNRRMRREEAVRSILYRALERPGVSATIVGTLAPADQKMLETKARALLPALRGEDRETLSQLLETRGAVETARHQCHSRRAGTRLGACRLLGDAGSPFAVIDLVPLLNDRNPDVRRTAVRALGRLGQPSGVAPLLGALRLPHPPPVDDVANAVESIRDCPVVLLLRGLQDPSVPARSAAVELLGRLQVLDAVDHLVDVVAHDPSLEVRVRAVRALGRLGSPRAVAPLVKCVHGGPRALRAEAVRSLGRLGAAEAVPDLLMLLLGDSLRLGGSAAEALAQIVPLGVAVLEGVADDDCSTAAVTAREALAAGAGAPSRPPLAGPVPRAPRLRPSSPSAG